MKVLDGIKGIANDAKKLDKHFIMVLEENKIIQDFLSAFHTDAQNTTRDEQYELNGSKINT